MSETPDQKLQRIQLEIRDGTYDTPERWRKAIHGLMREVFGHDKPRG